jgi:hypothetical protein
VARFFVGVAFVVAVLIASRSSTRIDLLRFPLAWIGVLVALDGLARWRRGASPLNGPADWLTAAAASVVFWDVFELVDLRLRNWWYVGVPPDPLAGAIFGAVSFATVLPAARLGLVHVPRAHPVALARGRGWRAMLGVAMLALALSAPRYAFPLAWIFLWPICESIAGARIPFRVMALGLPLGVLWEALNWGCARGWVYTVPFFDRPKVFEMPLPGYLGYLPFALECAAALAVVDRVRPHLRGARGVAALVAVLLFHGAADHFARGQTVLSYSR